MSFRSSLALLAMPVLISAAPATGDLALVQKHLQSVESMTASFAQTDRAGKVLTGTLTLKKPGKIRFQYEKGVPILIVGDGKALWFLDYSVGQKQRWPIGNSPLAVLLDPSRDLTGVARVVQTGDPNLISIDVDDPKHPEYGRITMVFARSAAAPAGLILRGWVALDSQSNRTTVRLSGQRFNAPVDNSVFRWTDPVRTTHKN